MDENRVLMVQDSSFDWEKKKRLDSWYHQSILSHSLVLTCPSYHSNKSTQIVDYLAQKGFDLSVCCLIGQKAQDRLGYMAVKAGK